MARPLRIEFPGAFYHVMNRGTERRPIFPDGGRHRALFKKTLEEAVRKWKIKIHAYSLMNNHYHLLVETPQGNISRSMRHIDGVYTQRLNRDVGRDGPLLRGRFKSILVQRESYFLELVRYIHLNGVRSGLYSSAGSDRNGSHYDYLHPLQSPAWLEKELVLSYFTQSQVDARDELDRFVHQGVPKEVENVLAKSRWPAIWGEKEFIDRVKEKYLTTAHPPHPEIPQEKSLFQDQLWDAEVILKAVSDSFSEAGVVDSPLKETREKRWLSMWFLREFTQKSYREIGGLTGGSSARAVEKFLARNSFEDSHRFRQIRQRLESL